MSNSKSDKPMRCSLDVRKIPIEAYKHPSTGRKWKAVARGMRAVLVDLASYADPNGALGKFSPKMETLEEHHNPSTLYDNMNKLRDVGLLKWDRENHYKRRQYTILLPGRSDPPSKPGGIEEVPQEHLRDTVENHLRGSRITPPRFADNTSEIRGDDSPHVPQNTEINEKVETPPSITVLGTVKPSVPPSVNSETVRNADLGGRLVEMLSAASGKMFSQVGLAEVLTLAAKYDETESIATVARWLKQRDLTGATCPWRLLANEFEATRQQMQAAEQRKVVITTNKQRAAESLAYEQEWNQGLNAMAAQSFLDNCADRDEWKRRFGEWIKSHPTSPVLFECDGKLISVDETKERIDSIMNIAGRHFDEREQAGVLY